MKTIRYRGGLVTFQIPKDWREEYEEDGGGTFYQPGDDTSTLRLNVLTFKTPSGKPVTPDSVILFLDPSAKKRNTKVIPLRPGLAYIRYDDSTTEAGQPITIRTWQLAQMVPPDHARIFVFTYTHLTSHFNTRATTTELALLEHSITICQPAQ